MNIFRPLKANEVEMRASRELSNGKKAWLLYKTARTDARLLDETFGVFGWNCDFKDIKGNLYCTITATDKDGHTAEKSDCGTESKMEAEKGEASDAFKRAGFKWGIGRELYSAPSIILPTDGQKYEKWYVDAIETDSDREQITYLQIHHYNGLGYYEWKEGWKGMHEVGGGDDKKSKKEYIHKVTAASELYALADELGWSKDAIQKSSQNRFGLMPEELTEKQLDEVAGLLKPKEDR